MKRLFGKPEQVEPRRRAVGPAVRLTDEEFHASIEWNKNKGRAICYQEFAPGKARYWFQRAEECVQVDSFPLRGRIVDTFLPRHF